MPRNISQTNKQKIVEFIHRGEGASRADIAKALGLSKPAVSENVVDLLDRGILIEDGIVDTKVGKKGIQLKLNPHKYYILVLDFMGHMYDLCIGILIYDMLGQVVAETKVQLDYLEEIEQLMTTIDVFVDTQNIPIDRLGVMVTSMSGIDAMNIDNDQMPMEQMMKHRHVREMLLGHYDMDVLVYNDVNLAAVGEKHMGAGRGYRNMAYILLDRAIGGAFIIHDQLYKGDRGAAGEVGYYEVNYVKEGHLQSAQVKDLISINALEKRINADYVQSIYLTQCHRQREHVVFDDVLAGRAEGDAYCQQLCHQVQQMTAQMIGNLSTVLDLDVVVVDGYLHMLGHDLWDACQHQLQTNPYNRTVITQPDNRLPSALGAYIVGVQHMIDQL